MSIYVDKYPMNAYCQSHLGLTTTVAFISSIIEGFYDEPDAYEEIPKGKNKILD